MSFCLSSSPKKPTRCVSSLHTFGAYVLQTLPNHRTATLRLFDATVAKLWQTTVLPASPGWFHVNRGEYPIVNSHKICEKKPKKSTGENFHPFCTCLMFREWLMEKPLGVVSSSILCPTWLKFAVAGSTKKKNNYLGNLQDLVKIHSRKAMSTKRIDLNIWEIRDSNLLYIFLLWYNFNVHWIIPYYYYMISNVYELSKRIPPFARIL